MQRTVVQEDERRDLGEVGHPSHLGFVGHEGAHVAAAHMKADSQSSLLGQRPDGIPVLMAQRGLAVVLGLIAEVDGPVAQPGAPLDFGQRQVDAPRTAPR